MMQGEESALSSVFRRMQDILFMDVHEIITGRPPQSNSVRRPSARSLRTTGQSINSAVSRATTFDVSGELARGREAPFSIAGTEFFLAESTWVFGDVKIGAEATVTIGTAQGKNVAKKIVIARPG